MAAKEVKTNVMRILDQKRVPYTARYYPHGDEAVDGCTVAQSLGQDPQTVFKTLVARGHGGGYFVFVIPVAEELDLKKAAKAVKEKSITMIHVKELLPLTGYVRGGCSPVGMKKRFPTVFHNSALQQRAIAVSAGKIGAQVVTDPRRLAELTGANFADLTTAQEEE